MITNHSDYAAGGHEERKEIRGLIETLKKEDIDCWSGMDALEELERRIEKHVEAQKVDGGLGRG